ncbi:hypothetical protein P4607_28635 [Priestia megaterium]|uniref:hypothetical protein n=1 Tax=Priestia megaterium TaxID=1404 RepID=UPI002E1A41FB|nr:hypothetical protein [Priestia megaterium]
MYSDDLLADLENSIDKYLIPKPVKPINERQKNSYMTFYKENISSETPIIRDIPDVFDEIKNYLELRIEEIKEGFETEDEEDFADEG